MSSDWWSAGQRWLEQEASKEAASQKRDWVKRGRSAKTFRYNPPEWHRDAVAALGRNAEETFKAIKLERIGLPPLSSQAPKRQHAAKKSPAQYHVWGSGPLKGETTFYRGTDQRAAEAAFDERAYRNYEGMGDDDENVVIERGGRELRRFGPEIHQPTYFGSPRSKTARHHSTKKKSPTQLDREIAEALELSKSGKGHRPSKLGGDYFTVVLTRAKTESTNEWNRLPTGWDSQTRGAFPSKYAAYKWARAKLLPGAPFTIRYVPLLGQ